MGLRNVAIAAFALLAAACNPQPPKAPPSPSAAPSATPPALHISGQGTAAQPVRIVQQRGNRVQYQLLASSFESKGPQGKARAVFTNAYVTFHGRDGSTLTARAPQAIIDQTSNTVTLQGGVHARSASGMRLRCEQLVYDQATERLFGRGNVVMNDKNGFRATGSSFDSDISLTRVQMR
jgi:LPS export ABC transporter protein LptC